MRISYLKTRARRGRQVAVLLALLGVSILAFHSAEVLGQPQTELPGIADEILQIQKELGGSIVEQKFGEHMTGSVGSDLVPSAAMGVPPTREVTALRDAAWEMDGAAHRLEGVDLYEQADALRSLSEKFRQDARRLRESQLSASRKTEQTE